MSQRDLAFQALDQLSGSKWLPMEALIRRLRRFGHSETWARGEAEAWMKLHSKVARRADLGTPLPCGGDAPAPNSEKGA